MQTIRRMELILSNLYKEKLIRGFCHLYSGQEACCVGMKAAMREQDSAITAYRAHGWTYIMGVKPMSIIAELIGREHGCSGGKGGSMHTYGPNFYGGNGIVGALVPLGTGVALTHKKRGDNGICITCYGDGAANQGQVFESFNMSYLFKLPVVYVCENNQYGMGTAANRAAMNINFYSRGDMIPGIWVDGMDVATVKAATHFAIDHALNKGPLIMELFTYRYFGHSMSDPGTSYRTREEINEVREQRDPITAFRKVILDHDLATEAEIEEINQKVIKEITEATENAKNDKEAPYENIAADVYFKPISPYIRSTIDYTLKHKEIAKRNEGQIIPPKDKPAFEGAAFTKGVTAEPQSTVVAEAEKKPEQQSTASTLEADKKRETKGDGKEKETKTKEEKPKSEGKTAKGESDTNKIEVKGNEKEIKKSEQESKSQKTGEKDKDVKKTEKPKGDPKKGK